MFRDHQLAYLVRNVKIREVQPLSFKQQGMAHVLSRSARAIPHGAVIAHFDVTPLVEYGKNALRRAREEKGAESSNPRVRPALYRNYWPFFIKTMAHCLHHVPGINVFLDYAPWRTAGNVYVAEDINIGFTVHTECGVIKPVIRNPHQKDLATVADEMQLLSKKARQTDPEELYHRAARAYLRTSLLEFDFTSLPGFFSWVRARLRWRKANAKFRDIPDEEKLDVTDILGATTTVANIGASLVGHHTVGVIMPPEIISFGISNVCLMPWVVGQEVVPRHVVTIAASLDHRVFDGGDAFPMFEHLKRYMNAPELIYEWKKGDEI